MKVSIRQLQVFDAVATLGSVTAAAKRLNMSQSAASSALTDLQIVLRKSLFARAIGRPLKITDDGKRLHPLVRSALRDLENIERGDSTAPLAGKLVIGATTMIAETELPRLCVEFMRLHPAVQIRVEAAPVGNLVDRISRFELETALIENFPDVDGIALTPWRTDELVLVTTPDHPLVSRPNLTIRDLAGMDWCMREAHSSVSARLRYLLNEQVGQLSVAFESTSNWAVRHAVLAGGGIGCLSLDLVRFDLDNGRLVQLKLDDFSYTRSLLLARPQAIRRSPLAYAFEEFILGRADIPAR